MPQRVTMGTSMNDSQRRHADHCKISHDEYKQMLIARCEEKWKNKNSDFTREKSPKQDKFTARHPMLIVGSGPSYYNNIEDIKKFPGKVVVSDAMFVQAIKDGIRPDHVMTLEVNICKLLTRMIEPAKELISSLEKIPTFICSAWTSHPTYNMLATYNLHAFMWRFVEEPRVSNVGLFGVVYAYFKEKADRIFIVGMEHNGKPYDQCIYDFWVTDFYHFVRDMPKGTMINCSDGGVLYGECVIDSSLKRLEIGNTSD